MKSLILAVSLLFGQAFASDVKPVTASDMKKVTVMVTDESQRSGGSGIIFRSSSHSSYVLTNSHVCNVVKDGGLVVSESDTYTIEQYKQSKVHDICVIRVINNLNINTKLAASTPKFGDKISISGHPHLLPTTISTGHISGSKEISLLVGIEKCTEKEREEDSFLCYWFSGMPVVKSYSTITTSALIAPGSSGSAVFNSQGEIVGLAFAGRGRNLSLSFVVPLEHIKEFLRESRRLKWKSANKAVRYSKFSSKETTTYYNNYENLKLTPAGLQNVFYPSVKDPEIETLADKVELCKKGTDKCQNLLKQ